MRLNLSAGIVCVLIAVGSEAATLTPKEDRYLRRHAVTLCAGPCRPGLDWSALQARLRGKRVVALGEFNHGSREIFEIRNDLIRSLARNGSLGALLFESGIGELAAIDGRMESLAPSELTGGFFGGWRTTEMQALMVFAQQARIPVAGFDVQRTARSFRRLLAEETQELGLGGSAFGDLEQRFDGIQQRLEDRQARYDALEAETLALVDAYRSARNRLVTSAGKPSTRRLLVVRTLDNRVTWLSYMLQFAKDKDWRRRWAARDAAMAENVVWLAENVYPEKTLVLIAHNFHSAKRNETESVMGAILHAKYGRGFYAIGMFAGSGSYANNSGKTVEMELPDASRLDLKEVIGTLRAHAT